MAILGAACGGTVIGLTRRRRGFPRATSSIDNDPQGENRGPKLVSRCKLRVSPRLRCHDAHLRKHPQDRLVAFSNLGCSTINNHSSIHGVVTFLQTTMDEQKKGMYQRRPRRGAGWISHPKLGGCMRLPDPCDRVAWRYGPTPRASSVRGHARPAGARGGHAASGGLHPLSTPCG